MNFNMYHMFECGRQNRRRDLTELVEMSFSRSAVKEHVGGRSAEHFQFLSKVNVRHRRVVEFQPNSREEPALMRHLSLMLDYRVSERIYNLLFQKSSRCTALHLCRENEMIQKTNHLSALSGGPAHSECN